MFVVEGGRAEAEATKQDWLRLQQKDKVPHAKRTEEIRASAWHSLTFPSEAKIGAQVVSNVADLDILLMHNKSYAAEIAHNVSAAKRVTIIEKARGASSWPLLKELQLTEEHSARRQGDQLGSKGQASQRGGLDWTSLPSLLFGSYCNHPFLDELAFFWMHLCTFFVAWPLQLPGFRTPCLSYDMLLLPVTGKMGAARRQQLSSDVFVSFIDMRWRQQTA
jgi:hypothetical protein